MLLVQLGINSTCDVWKFCQKFPNITRTINHGRTGRKKLGGRKEICPTFSDCARVVKKNFPEKRSKIAVDGGGGEE